jgi:hypothetical protein
MGTKSGKPVGRPSISVGTEREIAKALRRGRGIHKVARNVGVGAGTVQRVKATMSLLRVCRWFCIALRVGFSTSVSPKRGLPHAHAKCA